jgi:hypothetical protein
MVVRRMVAFGDWSHFRITAGIGRSENSRLDNSRSDNSHSDNSRSDNSRSDNSRSDNSRSDRRLYYGRLNCKC